MAEMQKACFINSVQILPGSFGRCKWLKIRNYIKVRDLTPHTFINFQVYRLSYVNIWTLLFNSIKNIYISYIMLSKSFISIIFNLKSLFRLDISKLYLLARWKFIIYAIFLPLYQCSTYLHQKNVVLIYTKKSF